MSELAVGSLKGLAANDFVIDVAAGSTLNVPPPAILQVVSTVVTTAQSFNVTANGIDISGLSASITPTSTSSKVYVSATVNLSRNTGTGNVGVFSRLNRNGTPVFVGTNLGNRTPVSGGGGLSDGGFRTFSAINYSFVDEPGSISSVTYQAMAFHNASGTNPVFLNRAASDSDQADHSRSASSIILMEVAG